jgi:hypothetical protein
VSEPAPEPLVSIYLTNAVRTSQGPGPGVKQLPANEANALIGMKYTVYGDRSPEPSAPESAVRRSRPCRATSGRPAAIRRQR